MKGFFSFLGIIAFSVSIFSCSTTKNITKPEQTTHEAVDSTGTIDLTEEQTMQFEAMFFEAIRQKNLGNIQNAVQYLSQCLEIDPNSSTAMFELANIHAANEDLTSASLLLEKAISINNANVWYKKRLAQFYQQLRKFSEAADIYSKLLENDPENQEYLYSKAILLEYAQKFDEAIEAYNALEKKVGINEQISVSKERIFVQRGQFDKAFREIEKLIENSPNESKYYGLLADLYIEQGDVENALKNYNKILEMEPDNGFVHFSLASYYLTQNNPEKAFNETLIGFESETVDLQTKLQLFMMMASNRDQSMLTSSKEKQLIEVLQEKYPNEYIIYSIAADYFLRHNELEEASVQLQAALEIDKNDFMLWQQLLLVDNDLQDWNLLYNHTNEVINLFPNQPLGYFFNAVSCIQLKKYDEILKVVDEGLDYVLDNKQMEAQFLMLKGEAAYNLNDLDEAFKLFDKSIEIDPENYIAMNNYAYYLSEIGQDLDKAERLSGKVIEVFPDNATYLDTYAWVLFKKGEYSLAKFYMEAAIKNDDEENATLLEHYGDILFMLEETTEAKKYWEKARDRGGDSEVLERKIQENKYFEK